MRLAQLRAAQSTLSTLVDGIPDEREPGSTRALLDTLAGARRTMFVETRAALTQTLPPVGSDSTRALAGAAGRGARRGRDGCSTATGCSSRRSTPPSRRGTATASTARSCRWARSSTTRTSGCACWRAACRRPSTRCRRRRATASCGPSGRWPCWPMLTLAVGVVVSLHVRRLLAPLARRHGARARGRARRSHGARGRPARRRDRPARGGVREDGLRPVARAGPGAVERAPRRHRQDGGARHPRDPKPAVGHGPQRRDARGGARPADRRASEPEVKSLLSRRSSARCSASST